jgi:hypothetical protein
MTETTEQPIEEYMAELMARPQAVKWTMPADAVITGPVTRDPYREDRLEHAAEILWLIEDAGERVQKGLSPRPAPADWKETTVARLGTTLRHALEGREPVTPSWQLEVIVLNIVRAVQAERG